VFKLLSPAHVWNEHCTAFAPFRRGGQPRRTASALEITLHASVHCCGTCDSGVAVGANAPDVVVDGSEPENEVVDVPEDSGVGGDVWMVNCCSEEDESCASTVNQHDAGVFFVAHVAGDSTGCSDVPQLARTRANTDSGVMVERDLAG